MYGVYVNRDEADLIMQRFDLNRDSRLNFHEFGAMFTPVDRSTA